MVGKCSGVKGQHRAGQLPFNQVNAGNGHFLAEGKCHIHFWHLFPKIQSALDPVQVTFSAGGQQNQVQAKKKFRIFYKIMKFETKHLVSALLF